MEENMKVEKEEHFIIKPAKNGRVDDLIIESRRCCGVGCLIPQAMLNGEYMGWSLSREEALKLIEFLQRNLPDGRDHEGKLDNGG